MMRVGRIVDVRGGVAAVELNRAGDCSGGGCAACGTGGEMVEVRWRGKPARIGQRVRLAGLDGLHKAIRWSVFLAGFAAALAGAVAAFPAARRDGPEGAAAVGAALVAGTIAWAAARAGVGRLPRYRLAAVEERGAGRP